MSATLDGIGRSAHRREDPRLLTGQGRFADDVSVPGQAFGVMVRSPHGHARLLGVDKSEALAMPGALAVLTGADYVADGLQPIRHAAAAQSPPDIRLLHTDGTTGFMPPQYPLATDKVRFVGEAVALVVAGTLAAAKDAAERVRIEYEVLPASADGRSMAKAGAPLLWQEQGSNLALDSTTGDKAAADAAFARAAHVVRLQTRVPRVTGVPMEPRAVVAVPDRAGGRVTLYAGGGGVVRPRNDLAQMLGLPVEGLRIVAGDVGGNFGTRNAIYPEFPLVVWAARRLGRPVKWTAERQECFLSDCHGRDLSVEAELALDAEGNFLALRTTNLSNLGAYAITFVPLTKGTELMSSIYHVPAAAARACAVLSNATPSSAYRSAGRPEVMFVTERLIDLAARAGGFDRVALRRRNLIPPKALPYRNPFGMTYDSGLYEALLDRTLAMADWDGFPTRRIAARARGRHRGIGLGTYVESQSGAPYERGELTVHAEGTVEIVIGTLASGQGHETAFAQLAAEWLGVPLDCVRLTTGDTDRVLVGGGTHSGRSLRHAATTLNQAALEIRRKGQRIAAHLLEAAEADLVFGAGRFIVAGTDRSVDLFAVARAARDRRDLPQDLQGPLAGAGEVESRVSSFPHGWHVCEVEVDPETGVVEIVRYTAVDDVGRAVNPLILHGQTHGGIAQGMGEALLEECVYDPTTGQLLAGSFLDYAMPRADALPSFITGISEVPSTTHPLGFRGGGEGGITPALAVIVNAIVDALAELGVSHVEMPATPQRVWQAIRAAGGSPAPRSR